jgi:2-oxoglutarate ferredoxin oxidoreductase subunit beta
LEHGKPLVFGKERKKGIRMRPDMSPEVVEIDGNTSGLLIHDERRQDEGYHFMLSRLTTPGFPEPIGVLRAVREPTYEELMTEQARTVIQRQGKGTIEKLLHAGETWVVS